MEPIARWVLANPSKKIGPIDTPKSLVFPISAR